MLVLAVWTNNQLRRMNDSSFPQLSAACQHLSAHCFSFSATLLFCLTLTTLTLPFGCWKHYKNTCCTLPAQHQDDDRQSKQLAGEQSLAVHAPQEWVESKPEIIYQAARNTTPNNANVASCWFTRSAFTGNKCHWEFSACLRCPWVAKNICYCRFNIQIIITVMTSFSVSAYIFWGGCCL